MSTEKRESVAEAAEEFPAGFAGCWTVVRVADIWKADRNLLAARWLAGKEAISRQAEDVEVK